MRVWLLFRRLSSPIASRRATRTRWAWSYKEVNGVAVKNLAHLVELLRDERGEFVTLDFEGIYKETIVFSHKEVLAATEGILTDNGVRSQGSPDVMAVWNAKGMK